MNHSAHTHELFRTSDELENKNEGCELFNRSHPSLHNILPLNKKE